jgi:hypothetical protein
MRPKSSYLKLLGISVVLFIISFLLTSNITEFINKQDILNISLVFSLKIIFLMLLMTYSVALSFGGWDKWEQYFFIPIPIVAGIILHLIETPGVYAVLISGLFFTVLSYDIYLSTRLKTLLLKPDPRMILRFSTRGALFLFSVLGGILVLINTQSLDITDIASGIAENVERPVQRVLEGQLPGNGSALTGTFDFKGFAQDAIEGLIRPYQRFMQPILAVLMFFLFQFYASAAYILYMITIMPVYWLAKRTGFLKTETKEVTQETLTY